MTARFEFIKTDLASLMLIGRRPVRDSRGYLERLYCSDELGGLLPAGAIAQLNRTLTRRRGTVRGMHYQQAPHAEIKLVSCLRGEVFDVAVDLRPDSPTFGHWHGERLSADNHRMLLIPEGFAHGFQTLTDDCEMLYCHSAPYEPTAERGVNAVDPALAIAWPLPVNDRSERDAQLPALPAGPEGLPR